MVGVTIIIRLADRLSRLGQSSYAPGLDTTAGIIGSFAISGKGAWEKATGDSREDLKAPS